MNGHFVPEGIDWSHGAAFALTHDPFLLHFIHRWWAWVVVAVLVLFARQVRKVEGARPPRSPSTPRSERRSSSASSPSSPASRSGSRCSTRRPAPCWSPRPCGARTSSEGRDAHERRFGLRDLRRRRGSRAHRPADGRGAPRRLHQHPCPVRSIYRWQGAVETRDEVAAILKTTRAQADALITRIAALHSYDVPCIVTWPIDKILGGYADWVEDSVG